MTEEKRTEGGSNKEKSGKRRYFRRRTKSKKPDKSTEQKPAEGAPAKSSPRSGPTPDRKGTPNKKRRSRRRRSSRRGSQPMDASPEAIREPEPAYEEPISVFVYTHVIRPAYRDMVSDFRSESSFLEDHERETSTFNAGSLLTQEIKDQIERLFRIGDDLPDEPVKKPVFDANEDWDDEAWDDWEDDWGDEEST